MSSRLASIEFRGTSAMQKGQVRPERKGEFTGVPDLFLAKNFPADVRPEFLEGVIQDSGFHLRSKVQSRLTQAPLLGWIISGGQTRFQCIACHLGPVKAGASGIGLGDEGTGYRVARAA